MSFVFLCEPCGREVEEGESWNCRTCGCTICPDCMNHRNETCWPCCKEEVLKVEKTIGIPWKEWKGRCHEIASLCLKKMKLKGKLRYGNWLGEISTDSVFAGRTFTHHGWVEMDDGTVFDPTRWVFFGNDPFIYRGEATKEYDRGGNRMRTAFASPPSKTGKKVSIKGIDLKQWFPKRRTLFIGELSWLANLPPWSLGERAKEIYGWLDKNGFKAFIPIDNWNDVMGG